MYEGAPTSLGLTRGHYFVTCSNDAAEFAVLPNDYTGASFLGMDAVPPNNDTNVIGAISSSWLRMLGGSGGLWDEVQPGPGTWSWTTADQVISNNAGAGRKIIWVAFLRPSWLADDNQFITLYTNYVSRVAQRYGSQLYAIEIWNEPWITCDLWGRLPNLDSPNQCMTNWQQMAQSYSHVLQAARVAIKSVAPNIHVIGPAWSSPQYGNVSAYLNGLGATSLLDALSFHVYDDGKRATDQAVIVGGTGTGILYPLALIKNLAAFRLALSNSVTPLLADEVGFYGQSALGIPNTGDPTYLSGICSHLATGNVSGSQNSGYVLPGWRSKRRSCLMVAFHKLVRRKQQRGDLRIRRRQSRTALAENFGLLDDQLLVEWSNTGRLSYSRHQCIPLCLATGRQDLAGGCSGRSKAKPYPCKPVRWRRPTSTDARTTSPPSRSNPPYSIRVTRMPWGC